MPWTNLDGWLKNSKPFLEADKIKTPTLFLCGEVDWNVPLIHSEQMYQALRRLGVPTELVVYPGESHGINVSRAIRRTGSSATSPGTTST